jgi:hypothetical protein
MQGATARKAGCCWLLCPSACLPGEACTTKAELELHAERQASGWELTVHHRQVWLSQMPSQSEFQGHNDQSKYPHCDMFHCCLHRIMFNNLSFYNPSLHLMRSIIVKIVTILVLLGPAWHWNENQSLVASKQITTNIASCQLVYFHWTFHNNGQMSYNNY